MVVAYHVAIGDLAHHRFLLTFCKGQIESQKYASDVNRRKQHSIWCDHTHQMLIGAFHNSKATYKCQ